MTSMSKGKVSMRAPLTNSGNGTDFHSHQFSILKVFTLGALVIRSYFISLMQSALEAPGVQAESRKKRETCMSLIYEQRYLMTIRTDDYFFISLLRKWVLLSVLS